MTRNDVSTNSLYADWVDNRVQTDEGLLHDSVADLAHFVASGPT